MPERDAKNPDEPHPDGPSPDKPGSDSDRPNPSADATPGGVFTLRPHPLFVVFHPLRQYAGIAVLGACAWLGVSAWRWAGLESDAAPAARSDLVAGGIALAARFVWAVLEWACRAYGVADERGTTVIWSEIGVLNRTRSTVPLDRLRAVVVDQPFVQRLLGIGTVGFASAGTDGFEVVWRLVGGPKQAASRVRDPQEAPP